MSRYLLYYAGMAADVVKEQIGLAVSDDGHLFARVNGTGLVLPRDDSIEWRSLRVCNPTVLSDGGAFTMYYQGIAKETLHTSIGIARSSDGIAWQSEEEPIISWRAMAEHDAEFDERSRADVLEPSVLVHGGRKRMWFVYRHPSTPGNALYHAEEDERGVWHVREEVLSGAVDFRGMQLHYPQVERHGDSFTLYFTLRNDQLLHGIFRMHSVDGMKWTGLEAVLPAGRGDRAFDPSLYLRAMYRVPGRLRFRVFSGRGAFGYAHPHVLRDGETVMFYHAANLGPRGLWLDIARCELGRRGWRAHRRVLAPARDSAAWDSYFVADPFVVVVPE